MAAKKSKKKTAKKASKKPSAPKLKSFPRGGAVVFIREFDLKVPTADLISKAAAKGFDLSKGAIYNERQKIRDASKAKLGPTPVKAKATSRVIAHAVVMPPPDEQTIIDSYTAFRAGYLAGFAARR